MRLPWGTTATNVAKREIRPARSQPMTLSRVCQSGNYIAPPELDGVKIWAWSLLLDGEIVAHMTADDRDLDDRRKLAERMVFAYNLEFGETP